eukprot:scaffold15976_cov90-Isochrysis_galbana.AAC.1
MWEKSKNKSRDEVISRESASHSHSRSSTSTCCSSSSSISTRHSDSSDSLQRTADSNGARRRQRGEYVGRTGPCMFGVMRSISIAAELLRQDIAITPINIPSIATLSSRSFHIYLSPRRAAALFHISNALRPPLARHTVWYVGQSKPGKRVPPQSRRDMTTTSKHRCTRPLRAPPPPVPLTPDGAVPPE